MTPRFSLLARGHELGGAPRIVIFGAKALLGAVVASIEFLLTWWAVGAAPTADAVGVSSLIVFVAVKVTGYTEAGASRGWVLTGHSPIDWACDLALWLLWMVPLHAIGGEWSVVAAHLGGLLAAYPWSSE